MSCMTVRVGRFELGSRDLSHLWRRCVVKQCAVAVQVVCGPTSTAAVAESGELFVWGNNAGGMLGLDAADTAVSEPTHVAGLGRVATVALGAMHGVALVRRT